jgi:myxalamid-type polyketide synthase MxaE and MxaD
VGLGAESLADVLRRCAQADGQRECLVFISPEGEAASLDFAGLYRRARAVAAVLGREGATGRALLLHPPGLEFACAFFGCLLVGVTPVPLPAPSGGRRGRALPRLRRVAQDAGAELALTTEAVWRQLPEELASAGLRWLATDTVPDSEATGCREHRGSADALAFIQYTSGSTRAPRGVRVSHANVLANLRAHAEVWRHTEASVIVSWLPHYHDLGLVYGLLHGIHQGCPCVLMAPEAFVERPVRWLRAITHYRGTHSMAPDFGYALCARKIPPEEREGLDLSSWRVAVTGAEPIRRDTLERFSDAFAPHGFRRSTFCPGYGLAEVSLGVTASPMDAEPVYLGVSPEALEQHRVEPGPRALVSVGPPLPDTTVRIVDPRTRERLPPLRVGEIWVRSPGVARGYHEAPEDTVATFGATLDTPAEGPFLRTGDLGFLTESGEVFVTGRLKDTIILRGRNLHPHDLEWTVEAAHSALRPGGCAAFALHGPEEQLAVLAELREPECLVPAALDAVIEALCAALSEEHGVAAGVVALLPPGELLKGTSGKLQRHACREAWLHHGLRVLRERVQVDGAREDAGAPLASGAGLEAVLAECLAARLGVVPAQLRRDQPFVALGLDSMKALELKADLERRLRARVALDDFLLHPTLERLAGHLARLLAPAGREVVRL